MVDIKAAKEAAQKSEESIQQKVNEIVKEFRESYPGLNLSVSVSGISIFNEKGTFPSVYTYVSVI